MRALSIGLLALMLTSCSLVSTPPESPVQESGKQKITPSPAKVPSAIAVPVKIYTSAADLAGKPFQDLGEVSGDACQSTPQDPLPSIPVARRRMQSRAAKMQANAVLQHRCEMISSAPGCYRQAVCLGSALSVSG